ncbi:MAG: glycosyltransferase family 2 protein [Bryobacteraceae bacterium]
MTAAAVIPNWNGGARLARTIEDLQEQTAPPARIVVVDNGSLDGSGERARAVGCETIAMGRNAGFAAAVNAGIRESGTELVAIVNNDVELEPEWLAGLTAAFEDSEVWFACGKLRSLARPGQLDGAYDLVCLGRTAWRCGAGKADGPLWNRRRRIAMAPMTAAVFRRELFDRVGLLDERFESYLEDVDFGIRCAMAGLGGLYVPEAGGGHWGSATLGAWSPRTLRLLARNQTYLTRKYPPARWWSTEGWAIVVAQGLWGLVAARNGGLPGIGAWLHGKAAGLGGARFERADGASTVLAAQELEIRELQARCGADRYWEAYFRLAGVR